MPTYEYFCAKCQGSFDVVQSMKDPHLKTCPENRCRMETWGQGEVKRQLGTGAGLIFKGSGFYITDYRSENYKEGAKKDSAVSSPAPAASAGGSEASKPKADAPAAPKTEAAKPSAPPAKSNTP